MGPDAELWRCHPPPGAPCDQVCGGGGMSLRGCPAFSPLLGEAGECEVGFKVLRNQSLARLGSVNTAPQNLTRPVVSSSHWPGINSREGFVP